MVIWHQKGRLLTGQASTFAAASALVTEAVAVRGACSMAVKERFNTVICESDSQALIDSVTRGPEWMLRKIESIVKDIWQNVSKILMVKFEKVGRRTNMVAHTVATKAREGTLPVLWLTDPPPQLRILIDREARVGVGPDLSYG
ncbi:unnamed protein product [Ilex paraguariensis]|uniref:RNase H type-1 domain-containing protein n=1 Tax=Ilex paraguariensis TaxID=185542 RepID=A0ABC8S5T5_9AQUA